jgi:mRNA interferase MazF
MAYVPERGDLVRLSFEAQAGHEQSGRRPAMVVSPREYNRKVGLALFCPLTTRVKGYPFEVAIPEKLKVRGAVLSDQLRSLDWRARRVRRIGRAPAAVVQEALAKAASLLT